MSEEELIKAFYEDIKPKDKVNRGHMLSFTFENPHGVRTEAIARQFNAIGGGIIPSTIASIGSYGFAGGRSIQFPTERFIRISPN